jgi:hypothetical protein
VQEVGSSNLPGPTIFPLREKISCCKGENGLVLFAMSRTPLKQVDLWRFLPVSVGLSAGIYLATSRLPYVVSLVSALIAVALLGIQIRLGRFPWFESKDGKKHPFTSMLEQRAAKGSREKFLKALERVPDVSPEERDRL